MNLKKIDTFNNYIRFIILIFNSNLFLFGFTTLITIIADIIETTKSLHRENLEKGFIDCFVKKSLITSN